MSYIAASPGDTHRRVFLIYTLGQMTDMEAFLVEKLTNGDFVFNVLIFTLGVLVKQSTANRLIKAVEDAIVFKITGKQSSSTVEPEKV